MLRNPRRLVPLVLALAALAPACGGGGSDESGIGFAVYADDRIGEPVDDGSLHCGRPRAACPPGLLNPTGSYTYEPSGEPAVGPEHAAGAVAAGSGDTWTVTIELTGAGAEAFQELTRRLAEEGREAERLRNAAVVVGDDVVAFTAIDYDLYPEGIQTTSLELFAIDEDDANALADRVNEVVEERAAG